MVSWREALRRPVSPANTFYAQVVPNAEGAPAEILIHVGFLPALPVYGTKEQQLAQSENLTEVEVQPVASFTASAERLSELQGLLGQVVDAVRSRT
jgi:hypothetical protein